MARPLPHLSEHLSRALCSPERQDHAQRVALQPVERHLPRTSERDLLWGRVLAGTIEVRILLRLFWIRKGPEPMRVSPNETAKDTRHTLGEPGGNGGGDWGMWRLGDVATSQGAPRTAGSPKAGKHKVGSCLPPQSLQRNRPSGLQASERISLLF